MKYLIVLTENGEKMSEAFCFNTLDMLGSRFPQEVFFIAQHHTLNSSAYLAECMRGLYEDNTPPVFAIVTDENIHYWLDTNYIYENVLSELESNPDKTSWSIVLDMFSKSLG